jgi:hypothetical protein
MGWWETGDGDDLIGDEAVDAVERALKAFRKAGRGERPTLEALLDALVAGLAAGGPSLFAGAEKKRVRRLTAKLEPGPARASAAVAGAPGSAGQGLVSALAEALEEIHDEYEESVDRKPRLSELLACFAFVLGQEPEEYLSGVEGRSVTEIAAELE